MPSNVELTDDVAYGCKSSFPNRIECKSLFTYLDFLFFKRSAARATLVHLERGHTRAHVGRYNSIPVNTLGQGSLDLVRFL